MATITIRNLDDDLKHQLRIRAAEHGRSMEGEVRDILRRALPPVEVPAPVKRDLGKEMIAHFAHLGGVDLPEIPRDLPRDPPTFE